MYVPPSHPLDSTTNKNPPGSLLRNPSLPTHRQTQEIQEANPRLHPLPRRRCPRQRAQNSLPPRLLPLHPLRHPLRCFLRHRPHPSHRRRRRLRPRTKHRAQMQESRGRSPLRRSNPNADVGLPRLRGGTSPLSGRSVRRLHQGE